MTHGITHITWPAGLLARWRSTPIKVDTSDVSLMQRQLPHSIALALSSQRMPGRSRNAKDHNDNKQLICGVCLLKPKKLRKISENLLDIIRDKVFKEYHRENWTWLPDVICDPCSRAIQLAAHTPGSTVNHIDYSDLRSPTFRPTRETPDCQCSMCWVGRMDVNEYRAFEKRMKEPVGRPRIHPEEEEAEPIMICSKCKGEYGRGKPHNSCNRTGKKSNVIDIINSSDEVSREQILADQLRGMMSEKGASGSSGGPISIAAGRGRGGKLEVMAAASNLQKPPVRYSHEAMKRLQLKMGATDRGMKFLGRFVRCHEGRDSVEPMFAEAMIERNSKYDQLFTHKMITFTEYYTPDDDKADRDDEGKKKRKKKQTREVTKPMAYCTDMDALVQEVMMQRRLNPALTKAQIGIDDGQKLLKVMISLKEIEEAPEKKVKKRRSSYADGFAPLDFKNSGVKKLLLLALTPISERHDNLATILDCLGIKGLEYGVSCDLKMVLMLLGKQGASSTHACPFCTASDPWLAAGSPITIGSLWKDYERFHSDPEAGGGGGDEKLAKHFNNVVRKPLVTGPDDKLILGEVVYYPEHHVRKF